MTVLEFPPLCRRGIVHLPACIMCVFCLPGHMLDTLARTALWDAGLDYLHGTGHGVGAFLNVHEGLLLLLSELYALEPLYNIAQNTNGNIIP